MAEDSDRRWSPARAPYAIAVSQAWWAVQAIVLFATDARNASGHAQQIYARQVFGQLRALRRCADMERTELARLHVDQASRDCLDQAIEKFDEAVPDATAGRDILEHFDDYARSNGRLQRQAIRLEGLDLHEAAVRYWGGGYDPATERLTLGPVTILVSHAVNAAEDLLREIYAAARAVDRAVGPSS